ncbi:hypothetical protein GA0115243_105923 [Streptomyces sp. ScaeMP-e83]|nr:hypothetical protein GA0115243_105923 [Streptomyces sp. ScaeMP-e83]
MPDPSQGVIRSGDGWAEPHWKVSSCQGNSLISRFDFTDHAAIVNELLNPVGVAVARGGDNDLHLGRTTSASTEAQRPVTGERRQPPEPRLGIRRFHQQAELWEPRLTSCLFLQQPPLKVHHRRWTAFMRLRALVRGHKGKELVQFAQAPALPPGHCCQYDVPEIGCRAADEFDPSAPATQQEHALLCSESNGQRPAERHRRRAEHRNRRPPAVGHHVHVHGQFDCHAFQSGGQGTRSRQIGIRVRVHLSSVASRDNEKKRCLRLPSFVQARRPLTPSAAPAASARCSPRTRRGAAVPGPGPRGPRRGSG